MGEAMMDADGQTSSVESIDVGARLKSVRKLYRLSQRQLAQRAGVTNATISLIEQSRVSPSLHSLNKVLDGIPISLADFFSLQFTSEPTVFFRAEAMPNISSGAIHRRLVGENRSGRRMTLLYQVYTLGQDTGVCYLDRASEEGGIVVCGQLELTVGADSALLAAGDGYYFSGFRLYRLRNIGDCNCILVSARCNA